MSQVQNNDNRKDVEVLLEGVAMELPANWKWMLALGILMLLAGTLGIGMSVIYTIASVLFLALLVGTAGILQIIQGIQANEKKWGGRLQHFLIGLIYVVAAGLIYWNPIAGAQGVTIVLAAFFAALGVTRVVDAIRCKRHHWKWVLPVLFGLVDLALAFFIMIGWPATSLWVIGLFVSIELIMNGWFLTLLALRVKGLADSK